MEILSKGLKSKLLIILMIVYFTLFVINLQSVHANSNGENDSSFSIETIYHVFYGDEKMGVVDNPELIEELKENQIEKYKDQYNEFQLSFKEDIEIVPEVVFSNTAFNEETVKHLKDSAVLSALTYEVVVGDKSVGHVNANEDIDTLVDTLKLEYVSVEELEQYYAGEEIELTKNSERIVNISFSEEISWEESAAKLDDVYSLKEIIKVIQQGTLEEESYTVEAGDVLSTIASEHDLSMEEIQLLNPGITEGTLLQIGDELNVTVLKPMVSVIVEKEIKQEETIAYETETKDDDDVWQGTTKVTQEGKDGKKLVHYTTTYENGRTVDRETVAEEIMKEPTNKVVIRGTKTSPSRGTGNLAWPAVGGYISSHYGPRWGRMHNGIDIARPSNYNILAADNGTVSSARYENGYGNTVRINHNNGMETLYAHLSSIDVSVGQTVGKGQVIGRMGSTGNSTGIHLHFEVRQNGQLKNPMNYLN
ncbi:MULTISPECIES: peptidoglycan DD-metalloendopeptidase family protein [Bacillaceae]|uniref:Peptidoglycan DD-metalloendopeptidase family protein n=1 Tax=Evansella alkalicola TaxID=745819 RepID=A0ABS6JXG1_9BACI|nr:MULTISPECIES: peptidoglycan DD-metalloendopeptidase family protein [Bacillaceae]MBU9722324.1 peptidoglycan DD-metalloendopeptidase family protein [Bacillus alkalicola]